MAETTISTPIDIEAVVARRKRAWLTEHHADVTIQERFTVFLPYMLFVIQVSFFIISAKHTIDIINRMAAGVGYAAAVGFEIGLVVCSLMIYQTNTTKQKLPFWWSALEALLFIVILGSNLAGSLNSVVEAANIQSLSAHDIIERFGTLSLIDQMALALAVVVSVIVPIGSIVVGQGIAHLVFEHRRLGGPLEQRWRAVEQEEIHRAIYAELTKLMPLQDARRRAEALSVALSAKSSAKRLPGSSSPTQIAVLPEPAKVSAASVREPVRAQSAGGNGRNLDARQTVRDYLNGHPDAAELSVRQLASVTGTSKTIAAEILAEWKTREHDHTLS